MQCGLVEVIDVSEERTTSSFMVGSVSQVMNKKQAATLFGLFFDPEDGGSMFL
jgi:hypothetical protein